MTELSFGVDREVTRQIGIPLAPFDDQHLSITRCRCGARFAPLEFEIATSRQYARECPTCSRKFFFSVQVRVLEVVLP